MNNKRKLTITIFILFTLSVVTYMSPLVFASTLTDLINVTKYHKQGFKGQGVKYACFDGDGFNGWSNLKNQGAKIYTDGRVPESYTGSSHGTNMIQTFHQIAPEAEIYISQTWDINEAWLRTNGITLVSQSEDYESHHIGQPFVSPNPGYNDITLCTIAGNNAKKSYGFHLIKDPSSNKMLFANGTNSLNFVSIRNTNSFGITIVRTGNSRPLSNYTFTLTNTNTGVLLANNVALTTQYQHNFLDPAAISTGDIIKLEITQVSDTANFLDIFMTPAVNTFNLLVADEDYMKYSVNRIGLGDTTIESGAIPEANYNKTDTILPASGRGPIPRDVDQLGNEVVPYTIKPDLCAPGGATSPTAPIVAGALAVLASAGKVDLTKPKETKEILIRDHVIQMGGGPNGIFGYGRLYLDAHISPKPSPEPDPVPEPVPVDPDNKNVLIYPNPASLSENSYLQIANFSQDVSRLDAKIYTINGEFVKNFSIVELKDDLHKKTLNWDLRNENGAKVAPGVYFISIKTDSGKNQIRKIAIQK